VPIWLLGSSLFSARLAASLGLPFAFASHFAPDYLGPALDLYRSEFRPSAQMAGPYAVAAVAVYAAETDEAAARLFTSLQQSFVNLRRGTPGRLPPPVESMDGLWSEMEEAGVAHAFSEAIIGSAATVKRGIEEFQRRTDADEIIVTAAIYDHAARLRSHEIVAESLINRGPIPRGLPIF
jgi:luciferase family oxidoreductase group 1